MAGALESIRIIEFTGIGPAPFCGMMLADHGADVIRIDRIGAQGIGIDPLARSRRSIAINMKSTEGVAIAKELAANADGVIEGYRPGVMERLGLGPDALLSVNPKLVYGRMTGWGQTGPLANAAGHDINYIALSGALHTCGRAGAPPTPPVNYLGDFGGGGMFLAFGMLSALLNVARGGEGQVVDCSMVEGSAALTALTWGLMASGRWRDETGVNLLDTGAHFYDVYETADSKWVALGAIEPQFYALMREKLGLVGEADFDAQFDPAQWPALRERLAAVFKTKTRDEWCEILEGTDACFAPVLSLNEAPGHPHNQERGVFVEVDGHTQPAPAPRFSRTPAGRPRGEAAAGADTDAILRALGRSGDDIAALRGAGVVG